MKKILFYSLMAVFTVLLVKVVIEDQDPILLLLGLFFIGSGISAFEANQEFGQKLKEAEKLLEKYK